MASILDRMATAFGIKAEPEEQVTQQAVKLTTNEGRISVNDLLTSVEKSKTSSTNKAVSAPNTAPSGQHTDAYLKAFLADKSQDIASGAIDAARIMKFFPELEDAFRLRTASILSGNNFMKYSAKFTLDKNNILTDDEVTKVIEIVENFFKKDYDLSTKLSEWLPDIFKYTGSKAVLVLPFSAVNNLRNDKIQNLSNEQLITYFAENPIYERDEIKFAAEEYQPDKIDLSADDELVNYVCESLKDMRMMHYEYQLDKVSDDPIREKAPEPLKSSDFELSEEKLSIIKDQIKSFTKDKKINFIDDPSFLFAQRSKRSMVMENLNTKIQKHLANKVKQDKKTGDLNYQRTDTKELSYLNEQFIDMTEMITSDTEAEEIPLIIELPSESVVPLIVPGNPKERIGAFIIINNYGEPITLASTDTEELLSRKAQKENNLIGDLYNTVYGGFNFNAMTTRPDRNQYFSVYKEISTNYIENNLKRHLAKIGLENVEFNLYQSTIRAMLSSILSKKQTNVLFVPASLMMYLSFKQNEYGVGVPLIQDIMFALSLKMTYLVTKMYSLMEDSVNTRVVDIQFAKSVPNAIQLMTDMKNHIVKQRIRPFSPDPDIISYNLASRGIQMKPNNIPGIENFSITNQPSQSNGNKPDEFILDTTTEMIRMGTGIPPVAFNQLGQNEYAISVISNDIFYSLKIDSDRKTVIDDVNPFVRNVIRYHPKLLKRIYDVLIDNQSKTVQADNQVSGGDIANSLNDDTEEDIDEQAPDSSVVEPKELPENITTFDESTPDKAVSSAPSVIKKRKIEYILRTISMSLPEGKISHHKAMIEDINSYVDIMTKLIDIVMPDDAIESNSPVYDTYKLIKANMKADKISEYMMNTHAADEFTLPTFNKYDITKIPELKLIASNVKRIYDETEKVITPAGQDGETADDATTNHDEGQSYF